MRLQISQNKVTILHVKYKSVKQHNCKGISYAMGAVSAACFNVSNWTASEAVDSGNQSKTTFYSLAIKQYVNICVIFKIRMWISKR